MKHEKLYYVFVLILKVLGHTDSILSLSTAAWDPKIFASSSKDNTFIIWNVDFNDSEEIKFGKVVGRFKQCHF